MSVPSHLDSLDESKFTSVYETGMSTVHRGVVSLNICDELPSCCLLFMNRRFGEYIVAQVLRWLRSPSRKSTQEHALPPKDSHLRREAPKPLLPPEITRRALFLAAMSFFSEFSCRPTKVRRADDLHDLDLYNAASQTRRSSQNCAASGCCKLTCLCDYASYSPGRG